MSGILQASVLKDSASATSNLTLDASGNVTVGNNLTVTGSTTVAATTIGNLTYTGTLTGSTGILNIGSGQVYKDASGNLGIGTTSPLSYAKQTIQFDAGTVTQAQALTAYGGSPTISFRQAGGTAASPSASTTVNINLIGATTSDGTTFFNTSAIQSNIESAVTLGNHPTYISFSTTPYGSTSRAERMRIDSSGNVGIGTATPAASLSITKQTTTLSGTGNAYGVYIYPTSSGLAYVDAVTSTSGTTSLGFRTYNNGTYNDAVRIDSSGNLNIGTAGTANVRLRVKSSTTGTGNFAVYAENSTPTALFYVRDDGSFCTGNAASSPYSATTGSAANVFVDSAGVLFRSTSSIRYKENVQDYSNGLADLAKLRPVTFNSKRKENEENPDIHTYAGFIAEEVHDAGLTEFVQYNDQGQPDALAYANMVALLTKSIQELSAKNDALETRLSQLEAK